MASSAKADIESSRPGGLDRIKDPPFQLDETGQREASKEYRMANRSSGPRKRSLSPLKRLEQYITAIFKLGRTERRTKASEREIQRLSAELGELRGIIDAKESGLQSDLQSAVGIVDGSISALDEKIAAFRDSVTEKLDVHETKTQAVISARAAEIHRMTADLSRRLDLVAGLSPAPGRDSAPEAEDSGTGLQAFLDSFYHNLENRFRGSEDDIASRLTAYRADIEAAAMRCDNKPVLDLGCGRGEWLRLLQTWGIPGYGIDLNALQIEQAVADGLDARLGDFQDGLRAAESDSCSAITAHHLIEHLPFPLVAWMVREAMRVLAPGGILILETPDVRNVLVGATSFHNDPTHQQPRTAAVMSVLLETAGFHPVEERRLHPHERLDEFLGKADVNAEVGYLLFGAQDLALLAFKPRAAQP